jgi:hypothetical protein
MPSRWLAACLNASNIAYRAPDPTIMMCPAGRAAPIGPLPALNAVYLSWLVGITLPH